jgi:hypothetical protein
MPDFDESLGGAHEAFGGPVLVVAYGNREEPGELVTSRAKGTGKR